MYCKPVYSLVISKRKNKHKKKSCYDPEDDDKIINIIENSKEEKCSFNELKNILKISSRTLTNHLDVLEDKTRKIIERDKIELSWSAGQKRFIRLTPNTKTKRKYYGPFRIDYRNVKGLCKDKKEKLEKDIQKYRRTKLVLFILFALSSGYLRYKNDLSEGRIVIRNRDQNDAITTTTITTTTITTITTKTADTTTDPFNPGFSPNDLERTDYQLSMIQTSMRLNSFSKEEAEVLLNEIVKIEKIKIKPFPYNGQIRYKIEDKTLQDFFICCCNIITTLVHVIRAYFFFHFNKHNNKEQWEERRWFYDVVGDEIANSFFQQIEMNHTQKKKTIQDLYIDFYQHEKQFPDNKDHKKYVDQIIQSCKNLDKDFFTKKKLEYRLLSKNNPNSLVAQLIMNSEDINQRQEKYEHPIDKNSRYPFIQLKDKYPFLFDGNELKNLVNPPFSRKWFKINLFD
jgi:hypothetical protein